MNNSTKSTRSFTTRVAVLLLAVAVAPQSLKADLVGPYTPDANTLFLLHFDEAAGGTSAANVGSKGSAFYSVDIVTASTTLPTVNTMLGGAGYVNGATNFHACMTNPSATYAFGCDFNNNGSFEGDVSSTVPSPDRMAMTNLNMGRGGSTPFTLEALIRPTVTSGNQEIICTDNSSWPNNNNTSRGFQFRITSGLLQFQFIGGSTVSAASGTIPITGNDAFVADNWYHVAAVYNGTTVTLYWTLLNPTNGAAHVLGTPTAMVIDATRGAVEGPLVIGNDNRNVAGEQFRGSIDEVRISSVARGAGQMQFFSPLVTIAANPVSQNVDYNQPVTFSVAASSQFPLGYQWRFNSNSIAGATNSSYSIANVAAGDAGYYDCVVTNTIGYAATSAPAVLVVGAANFLANHYSFTTDTSDSVGGQWGTNFGNATVTGGKLVLDGTTDTYMQLPGNLFNAGNATALTIESWATYGSNPNNVYLFSFGYTNFVIGSGIVAINYATYAPHNATGQTLAASPSDPTFAQTVSASGNLDGRTVHVACVIDPPNKTLAIYTNGVLEAINTNFAVNVGNLNDQLSYIGRSLWEVNPYLNASIDEIRIFKGALSPITIKQSQDQGPDTLLADGPAEFVLNPADTSIPVGQMATFTAAAVGYLPITYQWFKNGFLVPGETNATYSLLGSLLDNNATIQVWATNTIGVTTYVTNSTIATLKVFVPPTLAWLDAAHGGADNFWNTTSLNWTNIAGGGPLAFAQTNGVLFDSRGSGSPFVDVTQPTIVYNVKVDATTDYTLTSSSLNGSLEGQGSITKLNSGKLIIDLTNNLSGPVTISAGTLQVGNSDASGSLGSSQVTNQSVLAFNRADTALIIPNAIYGSGSVRFDGPGTVTVNGSSDYSGSTTVNAGILNLQSATGLGSTASGIVVANGAQLYITANVDIGAEALTISGLGDTSGALRKGGAGATTLNGPISLAGDSTIGVDGGATLTLSNVVSGSALLSVNGSGTLALSKANIYSGGTDINGPILNYNANGALGTGRLNFSGNGRIVIADGLNFTNTVTASTVSPGTATGLLMVNDNTNGTITTVSGPMELDATAANGGHFQGPLTSGYLNVTGPITNAVTSTINSRNGFVRFSGGGDYTTFIVSEGTTSIGANNGISPNAALTLATSGTATFDLNGFNQALTGIVDGGALTEIITNSTTTLSTLTLNLSAGATFLGTIAGKVALVQNGSGSSLYLGGTNAYTGNTTVNAGTFEIAQPTFASGSTISVASGAMLQLDFVATNTIAGLVLNGANQPAGEYNSTTSPSFISGSGMLKVVPVVNTPTNLTFSVSGSALTIAWPGSHQGWILQAQTNSISTGLSGNWVDVPGSGSVTQQVVNINPANPSVFYRLRSP